ncbi:conserved hypothetical protein [Perkinsus marinus ATCC 50983]|uniref:16S rRNA (uracil(1498)-N(3))-methyltransferase n=1 Tax=Perkinsus marinus (strain ATCC 50983 / TXsc) TaxID=423536 RepID=C5L7E4_PERM5|nr:conserved hypothetical protein [Perkinsus marinus ATCC 50983]EER07406.1 conserved hypothetical protein [Perkinsus marinus ATCC 50983]|eukprot:XP_002775590.1 conserved hypothetical protein [Perkinsus marinus ATCC 50983]
MNLILFEEAELEYPSTTSTDAECDEKKNSVAYVRLPSSDARAKHVQKVLKSEPGDWIRAGVIDGPLCSVMVEESSVELGVRFKVDFAAPIQGAGAEAGAMADPGVDLILCAPRPKVMARLWPTIAQLGVKRICIITAERVEKAFWATHVLRPEFYRPLLLKGLEQASVDTTLTKVSVHPKSFERFLNGELERSFPEEKYCRLVCHPYDGCSQLHEAVVKCLGSGSPKRVVLALGPEGGWLDYEIEMMREKGFECVTTMPRIFSTDVALTSLVSVAADARRFAIEKTSE